MAESLDKLLRPQTRKHMDILVLLGNLETLLSENSSKQKAATYLALSALRLLYLAQTLHCRRKHLELET